MMNLEVTFLIAVMAIFSCAGLLIVRGGSLGSQREPRSSTPPLETSKRSST